jgi:hypothetical protein
MVQAPLKAETCIPLKVVEGEGTSVKKTVSPPSLLFIQNDWNTDFAVPSNSQFRKYIATIQSQAKESATVTTQMFLKYSNGTADQGFNGTFVIPVGETKTLVAMPRMGQQPYQVNLNIGGFKGVGFIYTLSVQGCY